MYNVNYALEFKVTYFNLLIRNSNDHRVFAIFTRVPIPKPFVQFCKKKKLIFSCIPQNCERRRFCVCSIRFYRLLHIYACNFNCQRGTYESPINRCIVCHVYEFLFKLCVYLTNSLIWF